ncbi:NADPH:quinone reductase [Chthoniobacter flavus Ellin428]|uniref:NADPH:quinone reductase n=2 Tax=Chthoniobacter flavus TaxID=191863 RepID=B4D2U7_9BACT|nr:NADPH:quinone reductase [Chthoniobacter flavus Ellin428]TCO86821.1 NADPH:quinone reductase-like Zn-dependent oxidoreductase [Chthoniobacter flavus]
MIRAGGAESLGVVEIPEPEIHDDEVLVLVQAAGVNPVDTKIRAGTFPRFHPVLPATLGRDISGTIIRSGSEVSEFRTGEEVFGMLDYDRGSYAELAAASPREIARKPFGINHLEAAALPVAALTAWQALFEHGRLRKSQRVLIHGAGGGVGHYAVQFAAWCGAEVLATCAGSDVDFVGSLGAGRPIDYQSERFEEIATGMDLVLDLIGGEIRQRSWSTLKSRGILVSTLPNPKPDGRADVSGREVVVYSSPAQLDVIGRLVADGRVKVHLDRIFLFTEAQKAHDHLEREHSRGKTVLRFP